jgi:hypothetical protein
MSSGLGAGEQGTMLTDYVVVSRLKDLLLPDCRRDKKRGDRPADYVGGPGVEAGATAVPQRGQWLQAASSAVLQELQVLGAAGAGAAEDSEVDALGSSSGSAAMPFLNSFIDLPRDFAKSGSLVPPNSTRTITRMTSNSW